MRARKASMADARLLWEWANDPETRQRAFNKALIPYDTHVAWLRDRLESGRTTIWIFEDDAEPVGQVRFDLVDGAAEIDIAVAPGQRGRGYGRTILAEAVERFQAAHGRTVRPRALVLADNVASLKTFRACGFREVDVVTRASGERAVVLERDGAPVGSSRS